MPNTSLEMTDPRVQALVSFKDWSNYLLVTTVAAVGWIAARGTAALTPTATPSPLAIAFFDVAVWCLAVSALFGICTLALVPLVSEQLEAGHVSIYDVRASFLVFGRQCNARLAQACRPQHVLFMVGVISYAVASAPSWLGVGVAVATAVVGLYSIQYR